MMGRDISGEWKEQKEHVSNNVGTVLRARSLMLIDGVTIRINSEVYRVMICGHMQANAANLTGWYNNLNILKKEIRT